MKKNIIIIVVSIIVIATIGFFVRGFIYTGNQPDDKTSNLGEEISEFKGNEVEDTSTKEENITEKTSKDNGIVEQNTSIPYENETEGFELKYTYNIEGYNTTYDKALVDKEIGNNTAELESSQNEEEPDKYILSDQRITVESIGYYTGEYVEDGTNELVSDVVAIIIRNNSEQMLQVGDIVYTFVGEQKAHFRVTNLLPGEAALVMESSRRKYTVYDDYSYGEIATAFINYEGVDTDTFSIDEKDGELTLHNKSKNEIKKVYVYYKNSKVDGAYMGGITYRVPFENVKSDGECYSVANHFKVGKSEIVDIQIAE